MLELRQHYNLAVLLKVAGLSRSTFYDQAKALEAGDRHAGLKARIRQIYERHKGRYGYRRITAALRQAGETINHKAVQRLMQSLGLKSLVRPKKYRSYRGPSHVSVGSYDIPSSSLSEFVPPSRGNASSHASPLQPLRCLVSFGSLKWGAFTHLVMRLIPVATLSAAPSKT